MKKSRSLIAAIAFAGATVVASAAMAADISHAPTPLVLLDGTADVGAAFGAGNRHNTFLDQFTFNLSSVSNVDAQISSTSPSAANGLDITSLGLYGSSGLVASGVQQQTGKTDLWTLNTLHLTAGNYYLQVGGSAVAGKAGSFGGNLTVSPVPEPATYAMLLGGLGLIGFMRRRRNNAASQA